MHNKRYVSGRLIATLLLGCALPLAAQQLSFFHGRRDFPVPYHASHAITSADFNGDGNADVVSIGCCGQLATLFGNGKGGFLPGPIEPSISISNANGIFSGDFTGDGYLDVVVASPSDAMAMHPGDGSGRFGAAISLIAAPNAVALGDFNADHRIDFVVASHNYASVYLNNGDGTFQIEHTYLHVVPASAAVGDLNGDGHLDLVAGSLTGPLAIMLGDGSGKLVKGVNVPTARADKVQLADLNHDGKLDIVTIQRNGSTPQLATFAGFGNGTFQPGRYVPLGLVPDALGVSELTGDDFPDITLVGSGQVVIRVGHGDFSFSVVAAGAVGGDRSDGVLFPDLNKDGRIDILVGTNGSSPSVLLGNGDGTLRQPPSIPLPAGTAGAARGDFNSDGTVDIAIANEAAGTVSVLLNLPSGGLAAAGVSAVPGAATLYTADFTSDGKLDLLNLSADGSTLTVLRGNGNGTFAAQSPVSLEGQSYRYLVFGDFNSDNKLDIIEGLEAGNRFMLLLGNGDGTFQPPRIFAGPGTTLRGYTVADYNSDGKPDLAVISNSNLRILTGKGDGTFETGPIVVTQILATELRTADVNGDGKADLILPYLGLYYGNGNGTFQPIVRLNGGPGFNRSVTVSDLNNDGFLDFYFVTPEGNHVGVLLGKGGGAFLPARFYAAGRSPILVAPVKLNADALPDLLVVNQLTNSLTLLVNQTGTQAGQAEDE